MPIILYNLEWMSFNIFLALLPVLFAYLIKSTPQKSIRWILFPIWLAFLPNTLYLLTDLIHLVDDLPRVHGIEQIVILSMYTILILVGCLTYVLACSPFFKMAALKKKTELLIILFILNFLTGTGIILGRVFRFNSWDVILNPWNLIRITLEILTSINYLTIIMVFAVVSTIFYLAAISWYKSLVKSVV